MRIICHLSILITISLFGKLHAQASNSECSGAIDLGLIEDYCSNGAEYDNTDADDSYHPKPSCWFAGTDDDLWYVFQPTEPSVYIQILGETMNHPAVAIYEGDCDNLIEKACGSQEISDILELTVINMIVGETYYMRIDSRDKMVGTFELCLKSYAPTPSPQSDCKDAVVLCDKSPFQVENLDNVGDIDDELTGSCVAPNGTMEKASVWYVWTCDVPGSLTFTLTPNNPNSQEEDLDFVLYEMPGGLTDCDNRFSVRCMMSGESGNLPPGTNSPCYGATGLREGETDTEEFGGCKNNSNNFVAPLDMEEGKSYGLIVNNFSSSGYGFSIEFGGTGTFLGPRADFDITDVGVLDCDKVLTFTNTSGSDTDPIVDYSWTFGSGAEPKTGSGFGPHTAEYSSYGEKIIVLTVETSRGCQVTTIKDFYVEPCCQDTTTLQALAEATDELCYGDENGSIIVTGKYGLPSYQYSIDGINFQNTPEFDQLTPNQYVVYVKDEHGCTDSIEVGIDAADPISVEVDGDYSIDFGDSVSVNAIFLSSNPLDSVYWSPMDSSLSCTDCLDPIITPLETTTYTVTVIDANGCESNTQFIIVVNPPPPPPPPIETADVYTPNVFSPNGDGKNDYFNIFGNKEVKEVIELKVFDRWGNLLYVGAPTLNSGVQGWNGKFKEKDVAEGVYSWTAKVSFVNDELKDYVGVVTLVR